MRLYLLLDVYRSPGWVSRVNVGIKGAMCSDWVKDWFGVEADWCQLNGAVANLSAIRIWKYDKVGVERNRSCDGPISQSFSSTVHGKG